MSRATTIAVGLLLSLASVTTCWACEKKSNKSATDQWVQIDFGGGEAADNIAKVLGKLLNSKERMPTESVVIGPSDSVCSLLIARGYPVPCDPILPVIKRLNSQHHRSLDDLSNGEKICLPALQIEKNDTSIVLPNNKVSAEKSKQKAEIWRSYGARVYPLGTSQLRFEYVATQFRVPATDKVAARRIVYELDELKLSNVVISIQTKDPSPFQLYSAFPAPESVKSDCDKNLISGGRRLYSDLDEVDAQAFGRVTLPKPMHQEVIRIVDTQVESTPNLSGALMPQSRPASTSTLQGGWRCKWGFELSRNHGTHLASIIASQDNGTGFVGVWPSLRIASFDIADKRETDLAAYVSDYKEKMLSVFLFANSFQPEAFILNKKLKLRSSSDRFLKSEFGEDVRSYRRLLVVAAGQAGSESQRGVTIDDRYPRAPQNLGDLPNVVVVSACVVCDQDFPKLMVSANRSIGGAGIKFVHVAAPGGSPIPTWTSSDTVGAAKGTSEAAAYTAAIAGAMIQEYPETYTSAEFVKERLQVCSRPLPSYSYKKKHAPNPDLDSIAAGVVDIHVCLLDPGVSWILRDSAWQPVKIRRWGASTGFSDKMGITSPLFTTSNILRAKRSDYAGDEGTWTVIRSREGEQPRPPEGFAGAVKSEHGQMPTKAASIVLCDGTEISLLGTPHAATDIIVALNKSDDDAGECS